MTTLAQLAEVTAGRLVGDGSVRVDDVVLDSRRVAPRSIFCCVVGQHHDGHDHAPEAVTGGAVALLVSRQLSLDVPQILVPDVRIAMARAAVAVHGDPSSRLDVVGVTGTNGKTTVVSMIASILTTAGRPNRAIGTLTGARTTPEAPDLQRELRTFVEDGVTTVAMEVSSHALSLHRVDGVRFDVAVFTNLGVDHLDFHGTPEAYFSAKAQLFEPEVSRSGIVNVDDVHGRLLLDASGGSFVGVSLDEIADLHTGRAGSTFTWNGRSVTVPLPGRHNVTNALLAAAACRQLGVDLDTIVSGLAHLDPVPGRFETYVARTGTTVVVDYAHTPDALEQVLRAARSIGDPSTRLTVVFGCGGDRDRGKRPLMGGVAADLADRVILTTDNPRTEDPSHIVAEILAGVPTTDDRAGHDGRSPALVEQVPDREEAIRTAVREAGPNDIVLVAGKGHERGQEFADRVEPFDDAEVVRSLLDIDGGRSAR